MRTIPWLKRNLKFVHPKEMLLYLLERPEASIVRIHAKISEIEDKVLSEKLDDNWSMKLFLS